MFYQYQFFPIQEQIGRRIAMMKADLDKYASSPGANQKAIEVKTALVQELADYQEFVNNLFLELREEKASEHLRGYKDGYNKCKREYEPHLQIRSGNNDLDRFNSITRAHVIWPELF